MFSSRKKGSRKKSSRSESSPVFSARTKKDLRPRPPTADSHGREASLPRSPRLKAESWFGPQPRGTRKIARPFGANQRLEARLTATRARGAWRLDLPENRKAIRQIIAREALRSGVVVGKVAIEATVLRLELRAPSRAGLSGFFRTVAGRIPRAVTGAERGSPLRRADRGGRQFWDGLVATRAMAG